MFSSSKCYMITTVLSVTVIDRSQINNISELSHISVCISLQYVNTVLLYIMILSVCVCVRAWCYQLFHSEPQMVAIQLSNVEVGENVYRSKNVKINALIFPNRNRKMKFMTF